MESDTRSKPARKRQSTPRSKTGCVTCKIRRLKCGEERPSCARCVKSGWRCDGYEHIKQPQPPPQGSMSSLLPQSPTESPSPEMSFLEPAALLPLTEQEQFYFRCGGSQVTGQMLCEDMFLWTNISLRESINTPSVRHGMVALGALKQSTINRSGRYLMNAVPGHQEFALEQYHKALRCLQESAPNAEAEKGVRSSLVSCMVLAIFDDFIGQTAFALEHMRYARQVLCNQKVSLPTVTSSNDRENDKLASMFLRLDVLSLFAMGIDDQRTYIPLKPHTPTFIMPSRLTSLEEARSLSCIVAWEGYLFFYYTAQYQLQPHNQIPPAVIQQRDYLVKSLYSLVTLLSDLCDEEQTATCHPLSRLSALRLHPVLILVKLISSLGAPEIACDSLLPHFGYLLNLSKDILQYEASENPGVLSSETYSVELRTVSPLLLVATKCRNAPMRREAVSLLVSSHRREWMYDSFLAGQVGQWIMSLEEEGIDANGYIPEHARTWGESIKLDLQQSKATVKCRQNFKSRVTGKVEWRWREKHICW